MADEVPREDELESRQGAALYPVGRALRQTFDAENHDSLSTDLTGLMLELARIDPEAKAMGKAPVGMPPVAAVMAAVPLMEAGPPVPWWRAAVGRLLGR